MKIFNLLAIAAITVALVSFQYKKAETAKKHQNMYTIDKTNSTLSWKGGKNASYFHTGTVQFSDGTTTMEHGMVVAGNFTVDLSTIMVNDAGLPKEKQESLAKHLKADDFFNIGKFATSKVTIGEYKDGKLSTTINLLGVDIKQNIPVVISASEKGATITGKFDVDFTAAKIPGTQAEEGDKDAISPVFSFDLNLVLKAK